jgi:hypothetical protein
VKGNAAERRLGAPAGAGPAASTAMAVRTFWPGWSGTLGTTKDRLATVAGMSLTVTVAFAPGASGAASPALG